MGSLLCFLHGFMGKLFCLNASALSTLIVNGKIFSVSLLFICFAYIYGRSTGRLILLIYCNGMKCC